MKLIEQAIYTAYYHGELWYKCPHCGISFEYYDAVFEREGIKITNENEVYICSCGKKFQIK